MLVVIAVLMFVVSRLYYIENIMQYYDDELIFIDEFIKDGKVTNMQEHRIEPSEKGLHIYETTIESKMKNTIDGDALLVIPRLRGSWHKIYFNDQLIGIIGAENDRRVHIWNAVYKFIVPGNFIETTNTLRFETYSEYKLGYANMPIFIGNVRLANRLYDSIESFYGDFYLIVIGMLVALAVMELFLFILSGAFNRSFALFPIAIIFISIYLVDYTVVSHQWISALWFKKIIVFSFHMSAYTVTIAFAKIYKRKWMMRYVSILILGSILGVIFSPSLLAFSNFYNTYNLVIVTLIMSWIGMALISYRKSKSPQDYMIFITAILLLIPTIHDSVTLAFKEGNQMRMAVYGIIFYGLGMLVIALVDYIEHQKVLHTEAKLLDMESKRLKQALIIDELTGLYNHKHFY
jgi:hypothetical protein